MTIYAFTETRKVAVEKWREYKVAEKASGNPLYKDLRIIYNQMKAGKKIIDISKVIAAGGVHDNFHPKLAIAKATTKKIVCRYYQNGIVKYLNDQSLRSREHASDVILYNCLPKFKMETIFDNLNLEAPVPMIPPKHLPVKLSDDYYILWEVDEWKMVPPTDPWLLRRLTKTHFVVVAGWDLTEVEKSVMAGRMY